MSVTGKIIDFPVIGDFLEIPTDINMVDGQFTGQTAYFDGGLFLQIMDCRENILVCCNTGRVPWYGDSFEVVQ